MSIEAEEGVVSGVARKVGKGNFGFPYGVHEAKLISPGAVTYLFPPCSIELGDKRSVSTEYYTVFG